MQIVTATNKKVVVMLSGGADSVAVMLKLKDDGYTVYPLFFNYQQPNYEVERHFAWEITKKTNSESRFYELEIGNILKPMKYNSKSNAQAFVPGRNSTFMQLAYNHAITNKCDNIAIGYMKNDTAFWDNSMEHHYAMQHIFEKNSGRPFKVLMPFYDKDKVGVMKYSIENQLESVSCWSAQWGSSKKERILVCGVCANCVEREQATEKALALIEQEACK